MNERERYSRLEPLSIKKQIYLAREACSYFSPLNYPEACREKGEKIGNTIKSLSITDFMTHLSSNKKLEEPFKYYFRIKQLLDSLHQAGILTSTSHQSYIFIKEYTKIEEKFSLWLAPALGPKFIKYIYETSTIHITGKTDKNDAHAGTGILVNNTQIITCAHVINDMILDTEQIVNGASRKVLKKEVHPKIDVGLITLADHTDQPLPPVAFRDPEIAERVHTLGYPRIPLSREPALIMQSGEVVSEKIKTIPGDDVFLYSAIARPGNSGGPIISESGHIVGIVSQDLSNKDSQDAPFYAGVPTSLIQQALLDLESGIQLPIENYQ